MVLLQCVFVIKDNIEVLLHILGSDDWCLRFEAIIDSFSQSAHSLRCDRLTVTVHSGTVTTTSTSLTILVGSHHANRLCWHRCSLLSEVIEAIKGDVEVGVKAQ